MPGAERLALDPEDDDPRGQAPDRARELDRLADPERVGRRAELAARERLARGVEAMHRPGLGPGRDRVDDERRVGPVPGVDQPRRLELADDDVQLLRHALLDEARDLTPGGVVPPVGVADPDHHGSAHSRTISRSRKCVAHEMHGSKLRIACSQTCFSSSSASSW